MIKTTLISTAAALVLTGTASGQQIVCAVGYANALSTVGTGVAGTDDDPEGGLNRGALMIASEVECTSKTFLSDDPSLLATRDDFTDNGRRPWELMFKGSSEGLSGALQSYGYFGNGTGNEGGGSKGWKSAAARHAEELGDGSDKATGSAVPGTICDYFGGTNCDSAAAGNGFGSDGTPPGQQFPDGREGFVDAIQDANGPNGPNGNSLNNGNSGNNGNAASGFDPITVVDVIDGNAAAADIAPEPATMTLLASGLIGLAASARRKKNQK